MKKRLSFAAAMILTLGAQFGVFIPTQSAQAATTKYTYKMLTANDPVICQYSSDSKKPCDDGVDSGGYSLFRKTANTGNNITEYTNTGSGKTLYIRVNACDPTKATYVNGSNSTSITVEGSTNGQGITCVTADPNTPEDASTKKITVAVNVRFSGNGSPAQSGPLDVQLTNRLPVNTLVKTGQTNSSTTSGSSNLTYSVTLDGVEPRDYLVCVPSVDISGHSDHCVPITKVKGQVLQVNVDGNASTALATGNIASTQTQNDGSTCDVGHLSWLMCPVLETIQSGINFLESIIVSLLETQPLQTNSALYTVWSAIRNLTDIIFILVFFAMIFGNALGFDNYTVKKVLPRLIAAAVLVQFSFFLMQIAVDISNVLGAGIAGIFSQLNLGGSGSNTAYHVAGALELTGLVGLLGVGVAATGLAGALLAPVGLMLLAGIISILGAFLTLQARQIIIQLLVMLSPLAFAAWILPNTEKFFKLWWSNLLKLLLMFPLIVLLIQAGNVVAILPAAIGDNAIQRMLTALVPIIVFFMIPATFKMGGSLMTAASGFLQKRASGYASKIRGSELMKNAKTSLRNKALIDYDTNTERANQFGLRKLGRTKAGGALINKAGRGFSRVAAGQTFSVGEEGANKFRRAITAAREEKLKENLAALSPFMLSNAQASEIALHKGDEFSEFKDGTKLKDRKGNDVTLKLDNSMRAAALRSVADGGGWLEMSDFFEEAYDRTPTEKNKKGSWRSSAMGRSANDNAEIWFTAFGAHAASAIKALPHTNPGKGTTKYDTEGPEDMANGHQQSAIPRVQQDAYGTGGEQMYHDRHKNRMENLRGVLTNRNWHNIDRKILKALRATAPEYADEKIVLNGKEVTGEEAILTMISPTGTINEMPKKANTLPPAAPVTRDEFKNEKELLAFYDEYQRRDALWQALPDTYVDSAGRTKEDLAKFRVPPPNYTAGTNRSPDDDNRIQPIDPARPLSEQVGKGDRLDDPWYVPYDPDNPNNKGPVYGPPAPPPPSGGGPTYGPGPTGGGPTPSPGPPGGGPVPGPTPSPAPASPSGSTRRRTTPLVATRTTTTTTPAPSGGSVVPPSSSGATARTGSTYTAPNGSVRRKLVATRSTPTVAPASGASATPATATPAPTTATPSGPVSDAPLAVITPTPPDAAPTIPSTPAASVSTTPSYGSTDYASLSTAYNEAQGEADRLLVQGRREESEALRPRIAELRQAMAAAAPSPAPEVVAPIAAPAPVELPALPAVPAPRPTEAPVNILPSSGEPIAVGPIGSTSLPAPTPIGAIVMPENTPSAETVSAVTPEQQALLDQLVADSSTQQTTASSGGSSPISGVSRPIRRDTTTATGQMPWIYYKYNELTGKNEPISEATWQTLEASYRGDPNRKPFGRIRPPRAR